MSKTCFTSVWNLRSIKDICAYSFVEYISLYTQGGGCTLLRNQCELFHILAIYSKMTIANLQDKNMLLTLFIHMFIQ